MTRRYDAVLFDFDGVLADTEPVHWACWREILEPLEIDLTWEVYAANCIGVRDGDMLPFLASLARRPVIAESLELSYERKRALFRSRVAETNPCAPETIELIRSLTDYRLAVVTSSGRLEVEPVLERAGIRERLAAMVFGEDVTRHKPAPDPYLLAVSRLKATCPLVVEDSAAGVASARAAGLDVLQIGSSSDVPSMLIAKLTEAS